MNEAMDDLARRWQKCIDSRGHYFEGNIAPGPESEAESSESELDSDSDTEWIFSQVNAVFPLR